MKILITGGAGFIGSSLTDKLLQDGHFVKCIDNFDGFYSKEVKQNNLKNAITNDRYDFVEGDIRDSKLVVQITRDIDVIVHLAAKAGVRPSILDPSIYQEVNERGTLNLLEAAKLNSIKQFVFASSSSVYGINESLPWSEDLNLYNLISPYAATKLSSEHMGHVYSHLYGVRFIALRLFTVYGPRQRPDLDLARCRTDHWCGIDRVQSHSPCCGGCRLLFRPPRSPLPRRRTHSKRPTERLGCTSRPAHRTSPALARFQPA